MQLMQRGNVRTQRKFLLVQNWKNLTERIYSLPHGTGIGRPIGNKLTKTFRRSYFFLQVGQLVSISRDQHLFLSLIMSDLLAAFAIRKPSITVDTADGSDVVGGGGVCVKNVGMGTPATGVSHGGDYEGTRQSVFAGMEVMGCDDDTGVSGGENFKRKIGGGSTEVLTKSGGGKAEGQKVKNAGRKKAKKRQRLCFI
jgi:hypothetical protein